MSIWQDEYQAWKKRSLADRDYVYVWADGVHFGVRLEEERLCALVVIGVRPDGTTRGDRGLGVSAPVPFS